MKVLHLAQDWRVGGLERVVATLVLGLRAHHLAKRPGREAVARRAREAAGRALTYRHRLSELFEVCER